MNDTNTSGRVVLITGAGGGIGRELVTRFLSNDDTVIATDASAEALTTLADSFDGSSTLVTTAADITDEDDVSRLADVVGDHGGLDVLINGAGFFPFTPFVDMTSAQWRTVIDINLTGTFLLIHALLHLMKDRGWGRIINVGSASIFSGVAGPVHFLASPDSDFITGQTLNVDGGMFMN